MKESKYRAGQRMKDATPGAPISHSVNMDHGRCIDRGAVITILRHQQQKIERLEEELRGWHDFRKKQSVAWIKRTYANNVMDVYKCPDEILQDCANPTCLRLVANKCDHDYKAFLDVIVFTFSRFLGSNMAPGASAFIQAVKVEQSVVDERIAKAEA